MPLGDVFLGMPSSSLLREVGTRAMAPRDIFGKGSKTIEWTMAKVEIVRWANDDRGIYYGRF